MIGGGEDDDGDDHDHDDDDHDHDDELEEASRADMLADPYFSRLIRRFVDGAPTWAAYRPSTSM